jgi:hypothetical protein
MGQTFSQGFNDCSRVKKISVRKNFSPKTKRGQWPSLPNKKQIPGTLEEWEDSVQKTSTNQQLALQRCSIVLYIDFSGVSAPFLPDISLCKSMDQILAKYSMLAQGSKKILCAKISHQKQKEVNAPSLPNKKQMPGTLVE